MSDTNYFNNILWEKNTYYNSQNWHWIRFRLALEGISTPRFKNACDLGFGHGVPLIANAVSTKNCQWHGTDFNPQHVSYARQLAKDVNASVELSDQSYGSYINTDLPGLDFIALMGSWSWTEPHVRKEIIEFVTRHLSDGGIFCFNYISEPGQSHFAPFRTFVQDIYNQGIAEATKEQDRAKQAIDFVKSVMKQNPWYLRAYPDISKYLSTNPEENPDLFLHEFLNTNWEPMSFAQVSKFLTPANLEFGSDVGFLEHIEEIQIDPRQRDFLNNINDAVLRETSKDFIRLRGARTDYWVKSPILLSENERKNLILETSVALLRPAIGNKYMVNGTLGAFRFEEELSSQIVNQLTANGHATIEYLFAKSDLKANELDRFIKVVCALLSEGAITFIVPEALSDEQLLSAQKFNNTILTDETYTDLTVFVSPRREGGLHLKPRHKSFLRAIRNGCNSGLEIAEFVRAENSGPNNKKESRKELAEDAIRFYDHQKDILNFLGIQ